MHQSQSSLLGGLQTDNVSSINAGESTFPAAKGAVDSKSELKDKESEIPKKVMTTAEIREQMKNYQPGKVTALPPMMNH